MLLPQSIHIFEADAVAYIQEARQYASGNFTIALNGCWSPLHSWLLIPFIKYGVDPFLACRIINGVSGLICIPLFYRITSFFISSSAIRNILVVFSSLLFISMAFHRTGADTLQLAILIIYINLIYDFESSRKNRFLILATLAGAMAYYAKSYNLYFFILHITIVIFLVSKNLTFKSFLSEWKRMVIVFCSLLLFIGPYVAMISVKYHKFTVSTAGPITMNKSLEPSFTDGPKFFVPPREANALAIADDPTFFQKSYITPLTSKHYLAKEVKVIIINILEYFKLLNQVSIFSIGILSVFGYLIFSEKKELNRKNLLIIITTLVYPIGYMMIAV